LTFRHQGQQILVAVGGDQIEGEVNFLFLRFLVGVGIGSEWATGESAFGDDSKI
jgi:hypothetical protein